MQANPAASDADSDRLLADERAQAARERRNLRWSFVLVVGLIALTLVAANFLAGWHPLFRV